MSGNGKRWLDDADAQWAHGEEMAGCVIGVIDELVQWAIGVVMMVGIGWVLALVCGWRGPTIALLVAWLMHIRHDRKLERVAAERFR